MLKITAFHIVSYKKFYRMEKRAREIGCAGAKQNNHFYSTKVAQIGQLSVAIRLECRKRLEEIEIPHTDS
jgi:hypothetical protein